MFLCFIKLLCFGFVDNDNDNQYPRWSHNFPASHFTREGVRQPAGGGPRMVSCVIGVIIQISQIQLY